MTHSLSLREILIAPFRALTASGAALIVFEAVIFLLAATAAAILPASFADLSATWLPPGSKLLHPLVLLEQALGTLVLLLALIVTVALPTRIIWLYHTLKLSRLLLDFPPALARCARTALFLWRRVFFVVLASTASFVTNQQIAQTPPKGQLALYVVVTGLALIGLYHGLRFILALLTCIVVSLDVETQIVHIDRIVQRALGRALLIILLGAVVPAVFIYLPAFPKRELIEWPLHALVIWYVLTSLGVVCLEAAEAHARLEGRTFRVQPDQSLE